MTEFSASIASWVAKSEKLIEAVVKESSQRVVNEMQKSRASGGRIPVDTGFLRASLVPSINVTAVTLRENAGGVVSGDPDSQVALKLAGMKLGDTFYAVYGANYAAAVNYGSQGRAPAGFVEGATSQWSTIVNSVTIELKARMG